jgi:hypothetical protein
LLPGHAVSVGKLQLGWKYVDRHFPLENCNWTGNMRIATSSWRVATGLKIVHFTMISPYKAINAKNNPNEFDF